MLKALLLSFLFLVLFLVSGASQGQKPDSATVALGAMATVDSLLSENRYSEAVVAARSCQENYKDDPHWNYQFDHRLAIALLRDNQPEEALPLLEARVISHPAEAQGHRNLGACLLALGRRGRALSEYQQVVELQPRNASARLEYGQVLLGFRIYKDAEKELLTAANLCGNCPEVQPALARYWQAVNQPAKAAVHWRSVWGGTGNPVAKNNLLIALLNSGQDQAVLDLLLESPAQELQRQELQQLVAAEGRLKVSEQSLMFANLLQDQKTILEIPESIAADSIFWGQVSLNLLVTEYYDEALIAVNRAISLASENVVFLNNRVVLLQKLGRNDEADREWEKLLLLEPSLKGNQN